MSKKYVAPDYAGQAVLLADRRWYPVPPAPENVDIAVIFRTLAQIKRYGGAFEHAPTVGQHTLALARSFVDPRLAIHALLHDAPEAFTGDLLWPVKQAWPGLHETWGGLDGACLTAIYAALGVDLPDAATRATLKAADSRCCAAEGALWDWSAAARKRLYLRHGGAPTKDALGRRLMRAYRGISTYTAEEVAHHLHDTLNTLLGRPLSRTRCARAVRARAAAPRRPRTFGEYIKLHGG